MIAFLQSIATFYKYSLNNMWLIAFQRPDASRVAGYMDWKKKHNRQVKKGEKGIKILAPAKYRRCNLSPSDPAYHPTDKDYVIKGFRTVTVFDISQTEGDELPPAPNWTSSEKSKELEDKLLEFAASQDTKVEIKDNLNGAQGTSSGGKIELLPEAGTQVLIHELAHELLHKGSAKWTMTREEKELEAEAIAFVVGFTFGLDDLASPNYLALWNADADKIREKADRIRETALTIIKGVS
jgi:hypothetical protein